MAGAVIEGIMPSIINDISFSFKPEISRVTDNTKVTGVTSLRKRRKTS